MGAWPGDEPSNQGRPQWPGDDARYQVRPNPQEQAREQAQPDTQALPLPYAAPPPPMGYGQQQMMYHTVQPHSAALGVVASFFIPGLGSMLNEKVGKGIGSLVAYFVSWVIGVLTLGIGFILVLAVWIWGMVAANNDAHQWNRAHGIMS